MHFPTKLSFILLLMLNVAFAQSCTTVVFSDEGSLIFPLALLSAFLVALIYMLSQAVHKPEWENWCKKAGMQILVSLILISLVNLAILAGCAVSDQLVGQDMFQVSINYLNDLAYSKGFPLVYMLTDASIQNQLEAVNFKFTTNPLTGGGGLAKNAGEKTKANAQDSVINMLMPLIASLYAQGLVLKVIQTVIVPIFLPLAFVMRIFPQTRTVADYLIAICLGLALILPLTYVLNIKIAESILPASIITPEAALDPDLRLLDVASLIPQAIFLPNLTIVVTVSFIMSFSKLLVRGFEPEGLYYAS
ncbi:hypothetical protein DRN67_02995 [Candidatus Micrarchaeota archaeon]|nr:MAG: hypothetical protein DRN67_02995 [Candidatus Micrarchaeota archaeon]